MISLRTKAIFTQAIRHFSPRTLPSGIDDRYRGEAPRKFGYEAHHHVEGLLPRLKLKEKRIDCMPITKKEGEWSHRKARMGENDFVRIFGDGRTKQYELLTHIPEWLRGYKNTNFEYPVLMLKRREFEYWRETKPQKWQHMQQRIKFLYRRLNNKYRPPDVEKLRTSRYMS